MRETFADSFYWLALVNVRDNYHQQAIEQSSRLVGRVVTTEAVLTEVADALSDHRWRHLAVQIIQEVRQDPMITVIPWSAELFDRALVLYVARPDKDWGLTDCASFVVMQDRKIREALTGDHHFAQVGFRALMSET